MVIVPHSGKLDTTLKVWGEGSILHRVHLEAYGSAKFNPSDRGDARFSPLRNAMGEVVPTLYAGTTLDCALMETVFHDVPYASGLKTVSKTKHIKGKVHSSLRLRRDFNLIDLSTVALRKLGITRNALIDTDAAHYPNTRQWATALHTQCPDAEGLMWTSRQDDTATAFVLFGDRLTDPAFEIVSGPTSLLIQDGSAIVQVLDLAMRLGAVLV